MFGRIAVLVIRHRASCALALLALVVFASAFAARLRVELDPFAGDEPDRDDATLVIVGTAVDKGGVLTGARLDAVRALADALRELPAIARIDAITDHPASAAVAGGSRPARAWLQQRPMVPLLLDDSGTRTALVIRLTETEPAALADIATVVASFEADAGMQWSTGGLAAVRDAFASAARRDHVRLVPMSIGMITVVLALCFRRAYQVAIPITVAIVTSLLTVGLIGWRDTPLGLLEHVLVLALPAVATGGAVHLVARTGELARDGGVEQSRAQNIADACARTGLACAIATSIACTLLVGIAMAALGSFGMWAATAAGIAGLVPLVLGPLLLSLVRDLGPASNRDRLGPWLARSTTIARTKPVHVLVVGGVLVIAAAAVASAVAIEGRLADLIDRNHPVSHAGTTIDARLGGTLSIALELEGEPGHWNDPAAVQVLAAFEDWAATRDGVRVVLGPTTTLRQGGSAPGLDTETQHRAWLRLHELGLRDDVLDEASQIAKVTVRVPDAGAHPFSAIERELVAGAGDQLGVVVRSAGTTARLYHGIRRALEQLPWWCVGALMAAAALMAIPGWLRTREAEAAGLDRKVAIMIATTSAGPPMLVAALILAAGLGLLALSAIPAVRWIGALGSILVLLAWIASHWLMPAALALTGRARATDPSAGSAS